jgi:hypothetical protein
MEKPSPCYTAMPFLSYSVSSLDNKFVSEIRSLGRTCGGSRSPRLGLSGLKELGQTITMRRGTL